MSSQLSKVSNHKTTSKSKKCNRVWTWVRESHRVCAISITVLRIQQSTSMFKNRSTRKTRMRRKTVAGDSISSWVLIGTPASTTYRTQTFTTNYISRQLNSLWWMDQSKANNRIRLAWCGPTSPSPKTTKTKAEAATPRVPSWTTTRAYKVS